MGGVVSGVVDTVKDVAGSDLGKAAMLGAGAYYGLPALMGGEAATGAIGSVLGPDNIDIGGGFNPAGGGLLSGAMNWAKANPLSAAGLGLAATSALGSGLGGLGGNQPTSSTSTNAIDPEMKAAYLRNLAEARSTAANLGERQFAAFPEYSTNMVQKYMNPYQQDVINTTMSDLERQRQMQQLNDLNAATRAKAFGGSRQGVAEALTNEAAQRTAASTLANLNSAGFTQAQAIALQQEQARQAYEQQKLDAARNLGLERLNVSSGALGLQPANLGSTQTTPIYKNTSASALGGALTGGVLGKMIGPEYAGYGAAAGGLLGLLG